MKAPGAFLESFNQFSCFVVPPREEMEIILDIKNGEKR
jgi:hypothetical protein